MLDVAATPIGQRRLRLPLVGVGEDGRRLLLSVDVVAGQRGLLDLQLRRPARHPLVTLVGHALTVVPVGRTARRPLS